MRLSLALVVSLSLGIASQAKLSSGKDRRHWLQEDPTLLGNDFTSSPTDTSTVDSTGDGEGVDANSGNGFVDTPQPTNDPVPVPESGAVETPAPTPVQGFGTPAPTMTQGFGTPAPTMTQGFGTPAPTMTQGFGTPAPTPIQGFGTPAPTPIQGFETPAPTMMRWADTPAPTESPVDSFPWEVTDSPTARPESVYVATDDDPLQPNTDSAAWQWNDSNVDDVKHDRTVMIALTVTFSIGVCLAIITAQQMLENPNGCCVSICRILVALTCGITRCVCYPCRAICGCTNPDRRNHEMMLQSDDNYTHDLELS